MLEAGISLGLQTTFNAFLYYANSKRCNLGNPKAAAIYSATNTVVRKVATAVVFDRLATLMPTIDKDKGFEPERYLTRSGLRLGGPETLIMTAAIVTAGLVLGTLGGKKICQWSGNPITAKQIVVLGLLYYGETCTTNITSWRW